MAVTCHASQCAGLHIRNVIVSRPPPEHAQGSKARKKEPSGEDYLSGVDYFSGVEYSSGVDY